MHTNGTLGGFFYHLFSITYASLFFVVTFERLAKIFQYLKNDSPQLFKIIFQSLVNYGAACTRVNRNLHKYKNSCDSSSKSGLMFYYCLSIVVDVLRCE